VSRIACLLTLFTASLTAAPKLELYFIDVEGGKSVPMVSPSGQSMLFDAGWPAFNNRHCLYAFEDEGYDGVLGQKKVLTVIDLVCPEPGVDRDARFAAPIQMNAQNLGVMGGGPVPEPGHDVRSSWNAFRGSLLHAEGDSTAVGAVYKRRDESRRSTHGECAMRPTATGSRPLPANPAASTPRAACSHPADR
jgi:hypothetical protein